MHSFFTRNFDLAIIRLAAKAMSAQPPYEPRASEAAALLADEDFFCNFVTAPNDLVFTGGNHFQFPSAIRTPWENNNLARGRFFPCGEDWQNFPTVIHLHGWHDELGYWFRLPYLARLLRRRRINSVIIELPFHLHRRPREADAVNDFISSDLYCMAQAARQSIADARSLAQWLRSQTDAPIGLWGYSLGGWLSGLVACHEREISLAVLATPVADLKQIIHDLPFCEPARRSFANTNLSVEKLNLSTYRPLAAMDKILLQKSNDDQFVPNEAIEKLCVAWGNPEIWRLPHAHLSITMAVPTLKRTVDWIAGKWRV